MISAFATLELLGKKLKLWDLTLRKLRPWMICF